MIAGSAEPSPSAIVIWRDELNEGKVLLRDIIDLDATYARPDAQARPAPVISPDGQPIAGIAVLGQPGQPPLIQAPATAPATAIPFKPTSASAAGEVTTAHGTISESDPDDDDEMENWLSVAAIEAELKPKVIETFDTVAGTYKQLRRLQDQDIQFQLKRQSISPAQERKYKKLKNEIIGEVKSLRLNRARIDALVEQLYEINKRLVGYQGQAMRLAESHGVSREDFSRTIWAPSSIRSGSTACRSSPPTAGRTLSRATRTASRLRTQIHILATETGLEIGEFRKIVNLVQKGDARHSRQKGDGEANPPRHLDRQEIRQPRPPVPRSDPGRQHRPDEGGRQVRVSARLQVLDLRHLVDRQAVTRSLADQSRTIRVPVHMIETIGRSPRTSASCSPRSPRADAGSGGKARHATRKGTQDFKDSQGTALARNSDRRGG